MEFDENLIVALFAIVTGANIVLIFLSRGMIDMKQVKDLIHEVTPAVEASPTQADDRLLDILNALIPLVESNSTSASHIEFDGGDIEAKTEV